MISPVRLRQVRLARGLTQDELVARMGGMITKAALSLYEKGNAQPRPGVLLQLARALSVTPADLDSLSTFSVEFVAFRRKSGMSKSMEEAIQNRIAFDLDRRVRLQQLVHAVRARVSHFRRSP